MVLVSTRLVRQKGKRVRKKWCPSVSLSLEKSPINHCPLVYILRVNMLVAQSCPTLCDPMDYSPSGSSVHGILQARIPEWLAIPFFSGSSQPN